MIAVVLVFTAAPCFARDAEDSVFGDFSGYVHFSDDASARQGQEPEAAPVEAEEPEFSLSEEAGGADIASSFVISSPDDFRDFVINCADPYWSEGMTVSLETDIDLANEPFDPIPAFSGKFYGNKHAITNLNISGEYARAGLFAVLTDSAYVSQLRVVGSVIAKGQAYAGGIAGENCGMIQNCIFQGSVISQYAAGGIAGINFSQAYVTDCKTKGGILAESCAGGIAGDNRGTVISCQNMSSVTSNDSGILAKLSSTALVGGITGNNMGTVQACTDSSASPNGYLMKLDLNNYKLYGYIYLGVQMLVAVIIIIAQTIRRSGEDY